MIIESTLAANKVSKVLGDDVERLTLFKDTRVMSLNTDKTNLTSHVVRDGTVSEVSYKPYAFIHYKQHNVSAFRHKGRETVYGVEPELATHFLLNILKYRICDSVIELNFSVGNVVYGGVAIPYGEQTVLYANINTAINKTDTICINTFNHLIATRDFYGMGEIPKFSIFRAELIAGVKRVLKRNRTHTRESFYKLGKVLRVMRNMSVSGLRKYVAGRLSNYELPSNSADHHRHLEVSELPNALSESGLKLMYVLMQYIKEELGYLLLVDVLIYLNTANDALIDIILDSGILESRDMKEFCKAGKLVSLVAKSHQHIIGVDLKHLFEFDVLINRLSSALDWEAEKENRINPNTANIPIEFIENETRKLLLRGNRCAKYRTQNWKEFWDNRFSWASSGAFYDPEECIEVPEYIDDGPQDFKNKMIIVNSIGFRPFSDFIHRRPGITAKTSIKYEWGKQRAIYGCDINSLILATFAMPNCENQFDLSVLSGNKLNDKVVRARLNTVLKDRSPMCLDFEDFNSQHSISAMKAVLRTYYDVYSMHMSPEQQAAMEWTIDSLDNGVVVNNFTEQSYRVNGTLFSGWRLTSWMNTILNYVYYRFMNTCGDSYNRSVHAGDDVIAGVSNYTQVLNIYRRADEYNVRLSKTKCNLGSVREFLRIDHGSEESGQYLCRAIATLTHSRLESEKANDLLDHIEAHVTRASEIVNRGGSAATVPSLLGTLLYITSKNFTKFKVCALMLAETSHMLGGLNRVISAKTNYKIIRNKLWEDLKYLRQKSEQMDNSNSIVKKYEDMETKLSLPGLYDYVSRTLKDLNLDHKDCDHIYREAKDRVVGAYMRIKRRYKILRASETDKNKHSILHGIAGAYKEAIQTPQYGKSKVVGKVVEILDTMAAARGLLSVVGLEQNKMHTISLIV